METGEEAARGGTVGSSDVATRDCFAARVKSPIQGKAPVSHYRTSGFAALGSELPQRTDPRNWLVWHFTHVDNLPAIVQAGHMYSSNKTQPTVNVALQQVKARRQAIAVHPDDGYPTSTSVADHVPFYIAPRSPMLYVVTCGHADYDGGTDSVVFLGLPIGSIVDAGLIWCASDANAATDLVRFTRQVEELGSFVDFDLLCQKMWSKTPDDQNRPSRRAAEVLVLDRLPIEMITHVVAKTTPSLDLARSALVSVGGSRQYRCEPTFYYD
jgi:hypothetical protein